MLTHKADTVRFQMFIRNSGRMFEDRPVHDIVGLVEAPTGHLKDDTVGRFIPTISGDERSLMGVHVTPEVALASHFFSDAAMIANNTDILLRSGEWPLSKEFDLGALLYKKCGIPPEQSGCEVFTITGQLAARSISYDPNSVHVFSGRAQNEYRYLGRLGAEINLGWDVSSLSSIQNMSEAFRRPLWGFGSEPYQLPVEMPKAAIEAWKQARALCTSGLDYGDFPDRLQQELIVYGGAEMFSDPMYTSVLRHIGEHHPNTLNAEHRPITKSESEACERILTTAIHSCLIEEISPPAQSTL